MGSTETRVIVTADDFGLADEINRGIVAAHRDGIVTAASLLMNAPATDAAIAMARENPGLEIGIHLSIVEGYSLRGKPGTTTDPDAYFGDGRLCLHRHWKPFIKRYISRKVDLRELEEELELQCRAFLRHFPVIPFANATQHLHLLPGVQEIVLRLARRYGIASLRLPGGPGEGFAGRLPYGPILTTLGRRMRRQLRRGEAPGAPDRFRGFEWSGRLGERQLLGLLAALEPGTTTEIMTHPGYDCRALRDNLSWGYRDFRWQDELAAVTSPAVKQAIQARAIRLVQFKDLA